MLRQKVNNHGKNPSVFITWYVYQPFCFVRFLSPVRRILLLKKKHPYRWLSFSNRLLYVELFR